MLFFFICAWFLQLSMINYRFILRRTLMPYFILFALCLPWIGIGSWACLYSNDSRATRLLGIIMVILGMGVLSYSA